MKWLGLVFSLFVAEHGFAFERIVTLTPEIGEWTALILGQANAEKKMVGVSDFTDEPDYLKKSRQIGSYSSVRVEQVLSLKPDLIIASVENNRAEQLQQLKKLNLNVRIMPKIEFSSAEKWIEKLGQVLGEPISAKHWAKTWKSKVDELKKKRPSKKVSVFVEVQHQPLMSIGKESFLTEALAIIGMRNVFQELRAGYPKVSTEAVVRANPEVILLMDQTRDQKQAEASRADWQRFPRLSAIQEGKVEIISGNDFARISLRLLNGLKALESKYVELRP